jgi:hypothetical protein
MLAAAGIQGLPRGAAALFPGLALSAHGFKPSIARYACGGRVGDGGGSAPEDSVALGGAEKKNAKDNKKIIKRIALLMSLTTL